MPASVNLTDAAFRNVTVAPRPVIPTQSQRHEEDYDYAYLIAGPMKSFPKTPICRFTPRW